MKNFHHLKLILVTLVLSLFLLPLFSMADTELNPSTLWTAQQNDSRPVLMMGEKLIPAILREENKSLNYDLVVHYPQIVGTNSDANVKHFNELIQLFINKKIDSFKQDLVNSASNAALIKIPSYLKINYEMASFVSQSQQTRFISIRFGIDGYERGMAHPYYHTQVFNIDLGHDKVLALSDLFNADSNYLAKISAYCIQQLQAKKTSGVILPVEMIQHGASPKPENYKNWNLTLGGLLITFDEAQVAPRYFGAQEILIPNEYLKEIMTHQTACTIGILNCDKT